MRGTKPRLVVSNEAVTAIPPPPSWLPKDAKAEWKRVAPDLIARKVLAETDMAALENYTIAVAGVRETARILNRQGRMVGSKAHPLIRQQLQYLESSRRYAAELGLTPVSRQRAGTSSPGKEGGDGWSKMDL
jgi:P27 family predicted phage terminase small subunit